MKIFGRCCLVMLVFFTATVGAHAADVFFRRGTALYVLHDLGKKDASELRLDSPVGVYHPHGGAVVYIKGDNLHIIRNTRDAKIEQLDSPVSEVKMRDGLIAYMKGLALYVRNISDDASKSSRRIAHSNTAFGFDVAHGEVVFVKGGALYRVVDIERGVAERVVSPALDIQLSK